MAEVFIERLTIENFGPFYGETTFDFRPLEGRPGILIGGRNGAGKTHLLRALYLAVVGETGAIDLTNLEKSGSDATRFRFEHSLSRKAVAEGKNETRLSVEILQRDEQGAGAKRVTLTRRITHRPNTSPRWESVAIKPDGSQSDDDAVIQRLRDSLLPRHLARFFFFDAERSQSLNLGDKDIVEGVSRILGLWTYDELADDLRNLVKQKIPRAYNSRGLADEELKLSDLSADVIRAQGHLKAARDKEREIKDFISENNREIAEIEDELRALGAVDPAELERARQRREDIKSAKEALEADLRTYWESFLPLSLLGDFRQELYDYLLTEEKRNEWERSKATVEPKIPQIKHDVFDGASPEFSLDDPLLAYYINRLENALKGIFYPPPEGMSESVYVVGRVDVSAQVRKLLSGSLPQLRSLAQQTADIEKMTAELREIDSWLRQVQQDPATMARSGELRERLRNLRRDADDLQRQLDGEVAEQKKQEQLLAEKRREEENQRKAVEKAQQGKTLATLAASYCEAAELILRRAADQLRESIGESVGDIWIETVERAREYVGMEFDKNWSCSLIKKNGERFPWEAMNPSAGQRQIRILAFNESLRRLARLVPPLVVDTPLGRLDREIRSAVLEKLYLTGHQSIILSTNSEIDPEGQLFSRVRDRLARVYTLIPHGDPDSPYYTVSVQNDYFGRTI